MPRSRAIAWNRDELILATSLYVQLGGTGSTRNHRELSDLLRAIPIEQHLTENPRFRSAGSVKNKLGNIASLDPMNPSRGRERAGTTDGEVLAQYRDRPEQLHALAATIIAAIRSSHPGDLSEVEPEVSESEEGELVTRLHRGRERDPTIVAKKKAHVMKVEGALRCEACGFDFGIVYGGRGEGFIECHHRLPLSELVGRRVTRVADLALVCANCHRMIHRRRPWLTVEELRGLLAGGPGS
jgi:5-methylcytosine-specific restriction protein A